jgi:alanyl-tRNA synthetase
MFRIVSESAIAAGIRRIEAITGDRVEAYLNHQAGIVREIKTMLKNTQDVVKGVQTLMDQNNALQKKLEELQKEKMLQTEASLLKEAEPLNGTTFIGAVVNLDAGGIRDLAFRLSQKIDDLVLILGSATDEKVVLTIMLSDMAVETRKLHAGNLIRLLATEIGGGGGGQAHFATAGGSRPEGLDRAIGRMREIIVTQS